MVLEMNRSAIAERLAHAGAYLGLTGGFDGFHHFVMELRHTLGIPQNLGEMGVDAEQLDAMIEEALADPSAGGNPVEMTPENTRELYLACLG